MLMLILNLLSLLSSFFGTGKKNENDPNLASFNTTAPSKNGGSAVSASNMNRIGKGTEIEGDITSEGAIRIEGKVKGNIHCKARVIIGETGVIEGKIVCQEMEVMGKFNGVLEVFDTLILRSTALVKADVHYNKIVIDSGAIFEGNVIHKSNTQSVKQIEVSEQPQVSQKANEYKHKQQQAKQPA